MKQHKLVTAVTALAMTISVAGYAQPGIPKGPGPEGRPEILQQVTSFSGKAGEWVNNDDYVYDGFYLQTGNEKLLVRFPVHMGSQLTAAVKNGGNITVNGVLHFSPVGEKEISMVSMVSGGQTIQETAPPAPVTAAVEEPVTASSKVKEFQKTERGDVNGFILDNKTILRVPPHIATQLSLLASAGTTISYTGVKKPVQQGEAVSSNYSIVHCKTVTINGTQYLTR